MSLNLEYLRQETLAAVLMFLHVAFQRIHCAVALDRFGGASKAKDPRVYGTGLHPSGGKISLLVSIHSIILR